MKLNRLICCRFYLWVVAISSEVEVWDVCSQVEHNIFCRNFNVCSHQDPDSKAALHIRRILEPRGDSSFEDSEKIKTSRYDIPIYIKIKAKAKCC